MSVATARLATSLATRRLFVVLLAFALAAFPVAMTHAGLVGTPSPTPTEVVAPTAEATETGTPTPEPTETETPTPEPTETETPTPEPTETETPTPEATESETPTPEATETGTPTPDPSETATPSPTESATPEPTAATPEATATGTTTPEATAATPEATASPAETTTPIETATPSPTSTVTPSPTSTATPGRLDHFLCYETHRRQLNKKGVTANDDLGASTVVVRQAKRLCAPVNKNDEDPTAPSHPGHLTFYTIRQTSPRFDRIKDLTIRDQFGEIEVDLVRPERLLVPTSKSLAAPPPPPLATPLDHFKCYRVRGARVRVPSVSVQTQFNPGGAISVAIKRPRDLCFPVDKSGEGIIDPTVGLMCYQVRTLPQSPPHVFTTDQFGSDDYDLFGIRDLCVPLLAGPGTCGDGSLNAPGEQCETGAGKDLACPGKCNLQDCTCPAPVCGNLIVEPGEECEEDDDCEEQCVGPRCVARAPIPGPSCSHCKCIPPPPICGDNKVNQATEECDGIDNSVCVGDCNNQTCQCAECGDGVRNNAEQCDDHDDLLCSDDEVCTDQCTCCEGTCPQNACGVVPDGCGGMIDCGQCAPNAACMANQCVQVCSMLGQPCGGNTAQIAVSLPCCLGQGLSCCLPNVRGGGPVVGFCCDDD